MGEKQFGTVTTTLPVAVLETATAAAVGITVAANSNCTINSSSDHSSASRHFATRTAKSESCAGVVSY